MRNVLFVDRDGTLVEEPPDEQIDALEKVRFKPGVVAALSRLSSLGWDLIMVSNQDGLGTSAFPEPSFLGPHRFIVDLLASQGIAFREVFICPHLPSTGCACRKPSTGLVDAFLASNEIDRERSFVIGDRETDREFAENLGLGCFLLSDSPGARWEDIADSIIARRRAATVERRTTETDIRVRVSLDASACTEPMPISIDTGIGFFDHMLEQLALHGGFALELRCDGDLEVDEHHTVEDVALALGEALDRALADRRGIGRYGFLLPMDESLARVALDLSGRPWCGFEGRFPRESVGGLSTEMIPHFFRSFAQGLRATLHLSVSGDNTHHMVEACFKGVGRALRPAISRDGNALPSSKGVL